MREIKACNKFIKKYGEAAILNIVQNNYIKTFTDYGKMEFFLQQYAESIARKAAPKDSTSVKELSSYKGEDLRNYQPSNRKKTLFEKLEEIENG